MTPCLLNVSPCSNTPKSRRLLASVAVFAKAPVPGKCKTRLARSIGPRAAANVQRKLTERTVKAIVDGGFDVTLWCAPDCRHPTFMRLRQLYGVRLRRQTKGHLGQRMAHALRAGLVERPLALIVGADCAGMCRRALDDAVGALEGGAHVVFVPARDGGYVLVGVSRKLPGLFQRVHWGSKRVMRQTRRRASSLDVESRELAPLWDVDRYADWIRARREGLL